jgi:two-component system sensor histidine kinase UhpB
MSKLNDEPQKAELRDRVEGMLKLTDMTVNIIRRISSQLRSPVSGDLGLIEAIEMQIEQFRDRTGLELHFEKRIDKVDLEVERATAVFRILQEALTNILRHSGATGFGVDIGRDDGTFVMIISDNGKGITSRETSSPTSLGIIGMRERARLIGGDVFIARAEGQGTIVTVKVPL